MDRDFPYRRFCVTARRDSESIRLIEPLAGNWRSAQWSMGQFDTAGRTFTPHVEGIIRTSNHVVMVTLVGSAEHLEVSSDCGHRYEGSDWPGAVSFVPAHCTRHLKMRGVQSRWASVSLDPSLFGNTPSLGPFSNRDDPLIAAMLQALADQVDREGDVDMLFGEALGLAISRHIDLKYFGFSRTARDSSKLSRRNLARLVEYIDAHLEDGLQIIDIARLVGLSAGHFHRVFKATVGCTPLMFIQRRRIERAIELMRNPALSIMTISMEVGFVGPSHFARTFRLVKGVNPSTFRRAVAS